MLGIQLRFLVIISVIAGWAFQTAWAREIRITIPRRSELTPVQRLNREGVEAIEKHHYDKGEALFFKAYLYDPADPFTLNNLGYVAELHGNLDRAEKFYALASEQGSGALIDLSNAKQLEGKPMTYALENLKDLPMRVNRMNVDAIELLSQGRNFEADRLLGQALAMDPANPFTLNNLGVAEEATGDFADALKHYDAAADLHSSEPVALALKDSWRGKPVSEMAAESARQLRKRMRTEDSTEARATMLTFLGVSAANRNDWRAAQQDFLQAYSLDPNSAFSLNNLGYVAEKNGDLETAQFYYAKARKAEDASARVGLATQRSAQGQRLLAVAADSSDKVDNELNRYTQERRQQTGPIELIPRDNTPAQPSRAPNNPSPSNVSPQGSQGSGLQPRP